MKTKLITLLVLLYSFTAYADNINGTSEAAANAQSASGSLAVATSNGVTSSGKGSANGTGTQINAPTGNTNVAASDLGSAVGTAVAPSLTTTLTETCMGSTSFGAGFSGGSFSFGTTWRDSACVRRLDAREIKSFGDVQAAKEIMCDSPLVRAAFKRVGRPCVEDSSTAE